MRSAGRRAGPLAALAALVAAVLALAPLGSALGETSSDVRAQVAGERSRLEELSGQLSAGRAEVDELDRQIADLARQSIDLQGSLVEDRDQLSRVVAATYRMGGAPNVLQIAFASTTLDEFVSNLYYAQKVVEWQTSCIEQVQDDRRELAERMDLIGQARGERMEGVAQLEAACAELESSLDALMERVAVLEEEERAAEEARLAELARQAELERARLEEERAHEEAVAESRELAEESGQRQAGEPEVAEPSAEAGADPEPEPEEPTAGTEPAPEPGPETEAEPAGEPSEEPATSPEPSPDPGPQPTSDADEGWITCVASAYTIADNTPPGSTATASGIPLDESVPTVAMPLSISPERFFGQMIQIEYNGTTVVATVTDSGSMGGGSRGLDLTPAVFRVFGASTADEWGLRTVRYRFL